MSSPFRDSLNRRLAQRPTNLLDIRTRLVHFALINYALPKERLARYIPTDRFEIPEFEIDGQRLAMMSAVPYIDVDFHYIHLLPFLKFDFGQTNYRAYVIDKKTGEHCVWFFGTTLGSPLVHFSRLAWGIPWYYGRYTFDCSYDSSARRYARYNCTIESDWSQATIEIEDTGQAIGIAAGFGSYDEMKLIVTHPVDGFFYRTDRRLGTYSISHPEMSLTVGKPKNLCFSLYERLGLLSKEEMQAPHSIFVCPEIEYIAYMPPKILT